MLTSIRLGFGRTVTTLRITIIARVHAAKNFGRKADLAGLNGAEKKSQTTWVKSENE
jgi:hypothetical protein